MPDDAAGFTRLLHDSDLVLVPSARAGFDPAFVAAAEHGVPVLVRDAGGAGTFLGDHARVPRELGFHSVLRAADGDIGTWTDRARGVLDNLPAERGRAADLRTYLLERHGPQATARGIHGAVDGIDGGARRIDEGAWHSKLSARDVVLRNADPGDTLPPGRAHIMTTNTDWLSSRGGVSTFNRDLSRAFASAGADVVARVSTADPSRPGVLRMEPVENLHVRGVEAIWGVRDANGAPDVRAMFMVLEGLPPHVDIVVGHSRFSGGGARWLVEHAYPDAKYVHVLHTSPEVLDGLRGDRAQGLEHAETERVLMRGAHLVAGVGPLLGPDAARLSREASPDNPPPVHEIILDMPALPDGPVPPRSADGSFELVLQGRASDPLKGAEFAARVVGQLRGSGIDVRLTIRGADPPQVAELREQLGELSGTQVDVKPFLPGGDPHLLDDLRGADVVLMPSLHEGFGLAASEAARVGVPVVVGEGTGAGLFFGEPTRVPPELGEPATVRDGITVAVLNAELARITEPDGRIDEEALDSARKRIDDQRLRAWVDQLKQILADIGIQRARAGELRLFLDRHYSPGSAARRILDAMAGASRAPSDEGSRLPEASGGDTGGAAATGRVAT